MLSCGGAAPNNPPTMPADSVHVLCGKCRALLDEDPHSRPEDRQPCPTCGSASRHFEVALSATVTARSKLALKAKRPGMKRPFVEQVIGDDLHRKTGRWMKLRRVIDRLRNWYSELLTDPRTGEVVHKTEEPLTEHRGHGSAKEDP